MGRVVSGLRVYFWGSPTLHHQSCPCMAAGVSDAMASNAPSGPLVCPICHKVKRTLPHCSFAPDVLADEHHENCQQKSHREPSRPFNFHSHPTPSCYDHFKCLDFMLIRSSAKGSGHLISHPLGLIPLKTDLGPSWACQT